MSSFTIRITLFSSCPLLSSSSPSYRRHYHEDSFPHISDHGSCDVSASGVSTSVTISLGLVPCESLLTCSGVSPTHEPTVNTASCSAGIGHLDVTFHGGASWLYNLFSGVIAGEYSFDRGQITN
jgi:hypothetical protein